MARRPPLARLAFAFVLGQTAIMQTLPRPVTSVDLAKFVGTYYEIARFPNRFQKQCGGNVTASYAIREDGRLDVINRCQKEDGMEAGASGVAKRAANDTSNARLKVRFAPAWLSFVPRVWGDYWILGVGPEYSYAVVGNPTREYLWILSRLPRMSDLAYRQAIEIAASNGYEVSRLVKTPQGQE